MVSGVEFGEACERIDEMIDQYPVTTEADIPKVDEVIESRVVEDGDPNFMEVHGAITVYYENEGELPTADGVVQSGAGVGEEVLPESPEHKRQRVVSGATTVRIHEVSLCVLCSLFLQANLKLLCRR